MDVHTNQFPNEMSSDHVEINTHLDNSVILEPNYTTILISTMDRFCRVCGNETEAKDLVSIFGSRGGEIDIHKKITTHLQIQVLEDDGLPQQLCFSCICQLNICHQLLQVSQEADTRLRHMFQAINTSKKNSAEILNENDFQSMQHHATCVKDTNVDTLTLSTPSSSTLPEYKMVLIESDLITENKEKAQQDFVEETLVKPETVHTIDHGYTKILNEDSIQPIKYQSSTLKDIQHNTLELSTTSNSSLQDIKVVVLKNDSIKDDKEEDFVEEDLIKVEDFVENDKEKKQTTFSCELCGKHYDKAGSYQTHKRTHLNYGKTQDVFLCDLCGKHFRYDANLRAHKKTHLSDELKKKHPCTLCTKSFRSKFFLSEHMNMHTGDRPYSCSNCCKRFHSRVQLRQHHKTHISDSQKVACEICGLKFNRRGNLSQHIKRHSEDRKYTCRICKEEFTTLNLMLSHRKIHTQEDIKKRIVHGEHKEEKIFTCEICEKVLFKKSSFDYHLRTHNSEAEIEDEKLKCKLCGKQLASRASLSYHTKSQHSSERPWRCQFCAEGFMLRELLLTHERTHTGEKPYVCSICNKAFRAPNNLAQHMLMHSEQRNFQCPTCKKRFHRKGTLNVHIRTHTGEKPFVCDLCGRPFTQKNDMLKHQKTHGLQPQYSCEVCSFSFNFKKDLTKHKLLNHRDDLETDVPVIFTSDNNNVFGNITHIITEDGNKILLAAVHSYEESSNLQ